MSEAAEKYDGYKLNRSYASYKGAASGGTQWDADMIYGCVCDYGFTGYDCSQRECDAGDDIRTTGQQNEEVVLYCQCSASDSCYGVKATATFRLGFMGHESADLTYDASNTTLAAALQGLYPIRPQSHRTFDGVETHSLAVGSTAGHVLKGHPTLIVSFDGGETELCSTAGTTATIKFMRESGDLPPVVYLPGSLSTGESAFTLYFITYQTLECVCGSETGGCFGTFTLGLDGHFTGELPVATATAAQVARALAQLPPFASGAYAPFTLASGDPIVSANSSHPNDLVCDGSGSGTGGRTTTTVIEIRMPSGNQPALTLTPSLLVASAVSGTAENSSAYMTLTTKDGTTERDPCNAAGSCDQDLGECVCDEFRAQDSDYGDCGNYNIESSTWTGVERCAGYVDFDNPDEVVTSYNTEFLFYTDDGANNTFIGVNETVEQLQLGDDDYDLLIQAGIAPTQREIKDRGVHVLNMVTREQRCIYNMSNGTSAIALDLSKKQVYVTALGGNTGSIVRLTLPENFEGLLYANPYDGVPVELRPENQAVNNTFAANFSAEPYGLALDLRFHHRKAYWTIPGDVRGSGLAEGRNGQIFSASLDQVDKNGYALNIEELTPIIDASLMTKYNIRGGVLTPKGIALDLRKPHLRMYWLDEGVNSTNIPNRTSAVRGGRLFRANLDGTNAELVLGFGFLKNPTGLMLDLVNNTAIIGDETGKIWAVDMDYRGFENWNVSKVVNKPQVIFSGTYSYGSLCLTCTLGVRMKTPSNFVLDYRERDAWVNGGGVSVGDGLVETMTLYWTDEGAGVIAKGTYTVDTNSELGTWGSPTIVKHLKNAFGNSKPRGIAFDMGQGIPRGGQSLYECYGHGHCGGFEEQFKCICFDGWTGNCNTTTCPTGPAWFDQAWDDNRAHRHAPCSNMGTCNQFTGTCTCHEGFYGNACQFQRCVETDGTSCGARGRCKSMRDLALEAALNGDPTPYEYGASTAQTVSGVSMDNRTQDQVWDADIVHGCSCDSTNYVYRNHEMQRALRSNGGNDNTGGTAHALQNGTEFTGYDCTLRRCPPGDDPKTTDFNKTFEVQNITCGASNGTFVLTFRGASTHPLHVANLTLESLEVALDALETLGDVAVGAYWNKGFNHGSLSDVNANNDDGSGKRDGTEAMPRTTKVCDESYKDWGSGKDQLVVSVTFLTEFGDLPLIQVSHRVKEEGCENSFSGCMTDDDLGDDDSSSSSSALPASKTVVITESERGTKENEECSGRGLCDTASGFCSCFITAADGSLGSGTASTAGPHRAGFVTSDGDGNPGPRGDCGHINSHCDASVSLGVRNYASQDWRGHVKPAFTNGRQGG